MKRQELKNHRQKSREELQDYVADIQRLAKEAYPGTGPEFVERAAVDSFIDGIWDWEVQSLVRIHSYKNITAALAYVLEIETAKRTSRRPVMVHQLTEENPLKPKSSSSKLKVTQIPTYCATRR